MALLADDIIAFLDTLGIDRAVICGLSMGGYIAFALWRWHPKRIRGLILCNTRAGADTEEGRTARRALIEEVERGGTGAVVDEFLPRLLSAKSRETRPDLVVQVRVVIDSTPRRTIALYLEGMIERPDSTGLLPTIDVPTLLIAGSED